MVGDCGSGRGVEIKGFVKLHVPRILSQEEGQISDSAWSADMTWDMGHTSPIEKVQYSNNPHSESLEGVEKIHGVTIS